VSTHHILNLIHFIKYFTCHFQLTTFAVQINRCIIRCHHPLHIMTCLFNSTSLDQSTNNCAICKTIKGIPLINHLLKNLKPLFKFPRSKATCHNCGIVITFGTSPDAPSSLSIHLAVFNLRALHSLLIRVLEVTNEGTNPCLFKFLNNMSAFSTKPFLQSPLSIALNVAGEGDKQQSIIS